MNIIDGHAHVLFTERMGKKPVAPEEFIGQFRKRGVRRIFVSALDGLFCNYGPIHAGSNDKLARFAKECGGFIEGFCTVNPNDAEKAADELKRAVEELGMKGLKLHPWLQSFSVANPNLLPVMKQAEKLRVPVLFHDGTPPYATPFQIGHVAELFPGLIVILGHSGLKDLWHNSLAVALNCPRVYLCTCAAPFLAVLKMVEEIGADRILYGSDARFENPVYMDYNLQKIKCLPVSDADKEKILFRTALGILG